MKSCVIFAACLAFIILLPFIVNQFVDGDEQWVMVNRAEDGRITVLYMPDNEAHFYTDEEWEDASEQIFNHIADEMERRASR